MPQIRKVCEDAICGGGLGVLKGVFGISLFTEEELNEITSLKNLTASVLEKSPEFSTESVICDAIKDGQQSGLEAFVKNAPPELTDSALAAAELVCKKAFKQRFKDVLMAACLNLVGC